MEILSKRRLCNELKATSRPHTLQNTNYKLITYGLEGVVPVLYISSNAPKALHAYKGKDGESMET